MLYAICSLIIESFYLLNASFLPAATKLGQGNVFTGVCDSVHGGGEGVCLSACFDARPPPRTRQTPPPGRRQHTVNERPVRILLECILVMLTVGRMLASIGVYFKVKHAAAVFF